MQKLNRITMLLKPVKGGHFNTAVLKLIKTDPGISLSLKTEKREAAGLSLFLYTGKSVIPAGGIADGCLFSTLYDTDLAKITGAALFDGEMLVFKSDGITPYDAKELHKAHLNKVHKESISVYAPKEIKPESEVPVVEAVKEQKPLPAAEVPPPKASPEVIIERLEKRPASAPPKITEETISRPQSSKAWPKYQYDSPTEREPEINFGTQSDAFAPAIDYSGYEGCPEPESEETSIPFSAFPQSSFTKYTYSAPGGKWHYLTGTVLKDGEEITAVGVPGRYSASPPPWLKGFSTYLVSYSGEGYWLMFYSSQTKEPRFPLRSQHGG